MRINNKTIGIVTVLYNSAPVLKDFFLSLEEQTYNNIILYVVDNNSSDNSLETVSELCNKVSFKTVTINEKENWGVAKGNNIGIKAALADNCDYILLSNNDIVLEKTAIEQLLDGLLDNNARMAVPKIYFWNTDSILWAAGGYFQLLDCTSRHYGYRKPDSHHFNTPKQVSYSPTCFMLLDKTIFDHIGFMDENYFVYCDDADFVWRATIDGSEKLFYIPSSVIWHKESFSTGGKLSVFSIYYMTRNRLYFSKKHFTLFQRYTFYMCLFFHFVIKDVWTFSWKQFDAYKRGLRDGFSLCKSISC